ncbi:MAG: lipoprotein [Fibrobacteres bacterium]|nr:lipoprotein [Fibrobacterota bacterium]
MAKGRHSPSVHRIPLLVLLFLGGCAAPRGPGTPPAYVLSRLYFGQSSQQGPVDARDFDAFLDTCVTRRFPQGLTRYAADGQWQGRDGLTLKEKTVVVEIVRPGDSAGAGKIKDIIRLYKLRFSQESVLLVEENPSVEF